MRTIKKQMNISTRNTIDHQTITLLRLTSYAINPVIAALSLYLLIILAFHLSKINCLNNFCNSSPEKKHAITSKLLCFLAAIFVLVRSLSQFGLLGVNYYFNIAQNLSEIERNDADAICNSINKILDLTLIIESSLVYVFFWIRQRILYIYPEFKMLSNKCLRIISAGSIVVWLLYLVVVTICYLTFVHHVFSDFDGCTPINDVADQWLTGISISWLSMTVLMNIVLLSLFIYPLIKQEIWRRSSTKSDGNSKLLLVKRIKRATVLTIVAALSDVFAFVISIAIGTPIVLSVFTIDMLINLFAAIGCFDHWRSLLCPCKIFSLGFDKKSSRNIQSSQNIQSLTTASFTAIQRSTANL